MHSHLQRQGLQHGHVRLVVRNYFVSRLVPTSHMKTSALIRDQLQVWLHHYRVEIFDTTVVLQQNFKTFLLIHRHIFKFDLTGFDYFYHNVSIHSTAANC